LRASAQVPSSSTNSGRFAGPSGDASGAATVCTTRSGAAYWPGNTTYGCHCGSASRAGSAGSTSVRDQPKAKVSSTTSAISQPVLLGLSASMSPMIRQTPARVAMEGRSAHRQWLGASRQPAQRSRLKPPRARKGLTLRARRSARSRETAWGMRRFSGMPACRPVFSRP